MDTQVPLVEYSQRKERASFTLKVVTLAVYAASIAADILIGSLAAHPMNAIAEQYKLYVTPPGWMFSIWGAIYVVTGVMILYVVSKDLWTPNKYVLFNLVNISNVAWAGVWSIDTMTTVLICSGIIVLIPTLLFALWVFLYEQKPADWKYYAIRNAIAFYMGWGLAASVLNFGVVLVYYYGISEKQFVIIFWILVPLLVIGTSVTTYTAQKGNGFKSGLALWVSALWALTGAFISTMKNKDLL